MDNKAGYRFRFDKDGAQSLATFVESHCLHEFRIKKKDLNPNMIKDIGAFNKNNSEAEIKEWSI